MGMPVRLSDELMELAKLAADRATRSLTSQVEHWALIGRAVEVALDHASLTALKASSGKLGVAFPDAAARAAVTQAILGAVRDVDRTVLRKRIASGKGPLYGVERSSPDRIVAYKNLPAATPAAVHQKPAKYRKR